MPRGAWMTSPQGVPTIVSPTTCGPSAQLGAAAAGEGAIDATSNSDTAANAARIRPISPRLPAWAIRHSATQGDIAGAGFGGGLELVVERLQVGGRAVAPLERQRDQMVGEPGVLRQQRAVQIGADQVVPADALET